MWFIIDESWIKKLLSFQSLHTCIISPQQTPKEGLVGEHQSQGRRRRRRHRRLHRHHHPGMVEGQQQQQQQQQGFLVFNRGRLTFKVVK